MSAEIDPAEGHLSEVDALLTPLPDALDEIKQRRINSDLRAKVDDYLNHDIPLHFKQTDPVLYMARHLATPNHETIRFVRIAEEYGLPAVIGQDTSDRFNTSNILKHNLGKMPIVKGVSSNGDLIIEKISVIDFELSVRKSLKNITTLCGRRLIDFHEELFYKVVPGDYVLVDEAEWVDRNCRGNLLEHYKRQLSLLIYHGVMFEFYEPEDKDFVEKVLIPAYDWAELYYGVRPLIVDLVPPELRAHTDWNGYPAEVYPYAKRCAERSRRVKVIDFSLV